MSVFIAKDVHEKLDYVFVRQSPDDIVSVTYEQSVPSTLNVISCSINSLQMEDDEGNTYPANRAIILWVSGGTVGATETIRIQYNTAAGRILDEEVNFRLVASN